MITDDDDTSLPPPPASLPALSIDSPSVAEGDSGTAVLTFTVALSEASAQPVTVGYADAGSGTATAGVDYAALAPGTLTFAAGETSRTMDVTVTGDTVVEGDETVVVALSGPVNATIATDSGTGVITDDDNVPVPALPLAGLLLLALALGWTGWRLTYRHLRAGVSLLLLIALSGTAASAQTATSFEQLAALLESGDRITVTASGGGERTGRIVDISASALALLIDGERHDFGKEHVDAIHQWRRDDPVLGGLLIGLAIGSGLGALSFSRTYDLSNPGCSWACLPPPAPASAPESMPGARPAAHLPLDRRGAARDRGAVAGWRASRRFRLARLLKSVRYSQRPGRLPVARTPPGPRTWGVDILPR